MQSAMQQLTLELPQVTLSALAWGPDDGPLAVLLHGYPDTAHTWRHLGPALAAGGWRVVAPFTRGYAPSGRPADGSYAVAALMADAAAVHTALGGGPDSVLVGHDWGAITTNALGAHPASPYAAVVTLAVPPLSAVSLRPRDLLPQLRRSWYIGFHQVPVLSERAQARLVPRLWRDWSPGYDAGEDLGHVRASLTGRESAVLGYYRALLNPLPPPAAYRSWHSTWRGVPRVPTLHLHGESDGCLGVGLVEGLERILPAGSRVEIIRGAGHFLHLERPARVTDLLREFLADLELPEART